MKPGDKVRIRLECLTGLDDHLRGTATVHSVDYNKDPEGLVTIVLDETGRVAPDLWPDQLEMVAENS